MPTLLLAGSSTTLTQNAVYSTPALASFIQSNDVLETSLDQSTWTAVTATTTGTQILAPFVRCTTANTVAILKTMLTASGTTFVDSPTFTGQVLVTGEGGPSSGGTTPTQLLLSANDGNPYSLTLRRNDLGSNYDIGFYNNGGSLNFYLGDGAGNFIIPLELSGGGATLFGPMLFAYNDNATKTVGLASPSGVNSNIVFTLPKVFAASAGPLVSDATGIITCSTGASGTFTSVTVVNGVVVAGS